MTRSPTFTTGLGICALLGAADVLSVAGLGADDGPPVPVLVGGLVLGVITLLGVRQAWRDSRRGTSAIVGSRVLSALLGVPVFFVDDAPDWAPAVVTVAIVLTVVGVGLMLGGARERRLSDEAPAPAAG